MLELRALTKSFGNTVAVDNVSLSISKGEMVGIIGRSGAGKSTLLRTINRLVEPDSGDILWDGQSVSGLSGSALRNWRRQAAMIFQQFQLAPRLDVLTNVLIGSLHGRPVVPTLFKQFPAELRARAFEELQALDMAQCALQRAQTLSGGQQQRVAIARAMMQNPDIILADEPISSLDVSNANTVMQALQRINRERGMTVMVNLHTLGVARRYCPRIIGMISGKVVFDGPPTALNDAALNEIYRGPMDDPDMPEHYEAAA